jgi:hypothetical protein
MSWVVSVVLSQGALCWLAVALDRGLGSWHAVLTVGNDLCETGAHLRVNALPLISTAAVAHIQACVRSA